VKKEQNMIIHLGADTDVILQGQIV